jgi:hypothetical protein
MQTRLVNSPAKHLISIYEKSSYGTCVIALHLHLVEPRRANLADIHHKAVLLGVIDQHVQDDRACDLMDAWGVVRVLADAQHKPGQEFGRAVGDGER